jgi:hypothetical protein
MFWWADRFGWTPQQVEALPVLYRDRLPHVAQIVDKLRLVEQQKQARG